MATKLGQVAKVCTKTSFFACGAVTKSTVYSQTRCLSLRSTSIPGPIPAPPLKTRFSVPLVLACIGLGISTGSYIAKSFAAFLEETEMFVPDDDDD